MYRSFHIENFRCFRDFKIDGLERVNLIGGRNNVGKTAFLEALLFFAGDSWSDGLFRLTKRISAENNEPLTNRDQWEPLFPDFDLSSKIEVVGQAIGSIERSMHIAHPRDSDRLDLWVIQNPKPVGMDTDRLHHSVDLSVGWSDRYVFSKWTIPASYHRPVSPSSRERADVFNDLSVEGKDEEFAEALRTLDPRIKDLRLHKHGGVLLVHADIGGSRRIPLEVMGGGIEKLLGYVMGIHKAASGFLLIDEIENGIHYSAMKDVWTALAVAAREYDVQIFATTHSWECIVAAHVAFSESDDYDFRYHRLDRLSEDKMRAATYDQKMMEAVMNSDLEIR